MVTPVGSESNTRRFCWEQVLRTNRAFRISQVFAPAEQAGQLLALYALLGAVEETCSAYSDEEVARRKLHWWRTECRRLDADGGDHPITRELWRTGAHRKLRRDSLGQLFDDAEARLDAAAPADLDELRGLCRALSKPQVELELSLWDDAQPVDPLIDALGGASGLAQILRETTRRESSDRYWWLPLSLLARHGVNRSSIDEHAKAESVQALFTELLDHCGGWNTTEAAASPASAHALPATRHLFVIGQLQANALLRLRASRPHCFAAELNRVGPPQLYQAWKTARRFNRP